MGCWQAQGVLLQIIAIKYFHPFTFAAVNKQILEKLRTYCAYQERCHEEVRSKLLEYKVYGEDLEEIISQLVQDDFLNEERFAKAYAGGKFRIKHWGREKIKAELKFRKVSDYCIRKGLDEIPESDYLATLDQLYRKAKQQYKVGTPAQRHLKIRQFLLRKGYESSLIAQKMKA